MKKTTQIEAIFFSIVVKISKASSESAKLDLQNVRIFFTIAWIARKNKVSICNTCSEFNPNNLNYN